MMLTLRKYGVKYALPKNGGYKPKTGLDAQKGVHMNPAEKNLFTHNTPSKKSRLSKDERESKIQEKAALKNERAEQMTVEIEKVDAALKKLRSSDQKSAEHTYNAGSALNRIKENKLYLVKNTRHTFKSFKDFVGVKFGISEQYAYMLINACKVQDILTKAGIANSFVPEKLLRKLTYLLRVKNGSAKIEDIWKTATDGKADKIPTDKELCDTIAEFRPSHAQHPSKRSETDILNDPHAGASEIIHLLSQWSNGKIVLTPEQLDTLKYRVDMLFSMNTNTAEKIA